MRIKRRIAIGFVCILFASTAHAGEQVERATFGADWPFAFDQAEVTCEGSGNNVVLKADGKTYALNGKARALIGKRGYIDANDIRPRDASGFFANGVATVGKLIEAGLRYCR